MRRNFNNRMETVAPVTNPAIQAELKPILGVYEGDNASAWDMQPDGTTCAGDRKRASPAGTFQQLFIQLATEALSPQAAKKQGTIRIRECPPRAGVCANSRRA